MTVVLILAGIFICVVLGIHVFITGNAIEKNIAALQESIEKYYNRNNNNNNEEQE